jgi:hypothetical protein
MRDSPLRFFLGSLPHAASERGLNRNADPEYYFPSDIRRFSLAGVDAE